MAVTALNEEYQRGKILGFPEFEGYFFLIFFLNFTTK